MLIAVWLLNLADRDPSRPRWRALGLSLTMILLLMIGLMLTKSRSAQVGFLVGVAIAAYQLRDRVPRRLLLIVVGWGLAIVLLMIGAGVAAGRLDFQVLTESFKSLRYRSEYWRATWGVITGGAGDLRTGLKSPVFWLGVGPGNFRVHYLLHKLPQSSEEIQDPHDLFLEVWATAGVWALLALVLALAIGLRNALGRPIVTRPPDNEPARPPDEESGPPRRPRWLWTWAGGGWILVVLFGMMNLFENDMFPRWLILGTGWLVGALLIGPLWSRLPIPGLAMGAAVVSVVVNLLAAGGIGIPTVALALWTTMAIGLNLRDDRPCGRLHDRPGRLPAFVLSTAWAALIGVFLGGVVVTYWQAEDAIAEAEDALRHQPPNFDAAESAYRRAIKADLYYARPWLEYADLAYRAWEWRGARPVRTNAGR